jgi:hypothetical protein
VTKALSIALLIGGVITILYGIDASQSLGSHVSRIFTGTPTGKALWLMIGGAVAALIGLFGSSGDSRGR